MEIKPISLIILVHQEASSIEEVIKEFYEKVTSKIPGSEFIVCEDGSTDGTKEILLKIKSNYNLTLDINEGRRGYVGAMRDGLKRAKNSVIFFSDSDGQHDPGDFWKMYPLMENNDMVVGWKQNRKDPFYRLVMTRIFNSLIGWYFKVKFHDANCGFRLFKKEVVNFLLLQNWRLKYCNSSELTVKVVATGFKAAEVPVSHFERRSGPSVGVPIMKLPKIVWHILKNFPRVKKDAKALKERTSTK